VSKVGFLHLSKIKKNHPGNSPPDCAPDFAQGSQRVSKVE
jgi:hypothetical protein